VQLGLLCPFSYTGASVHNGMPHSLNACSIMSGPAFLQQDSATAYTTDNCLQCLGVLLARIS